MREFKRFFKNHVCISYIVSINFMLVLLSWLLLQLTVTLVYLFNNWPFMIYILVTVLQKDKEQVKKSIFQYTWFWFLSCITILSAMALVSLSYDYFGIKMRLIIIFFASSTTRLKVSTWLIRGKVVHLFINI